MSHEKGDWGAFPNKLKIADMGPSFIACKSVIGLPVTLLASLLCLDFLHKNEYNCFVDIMPPLDMLLFLLEAQMDKLNGYMTAKEMAARWAVSVRQVQFWCSEGKIEGVVQFGKSWAIPDNASKPTRTVNMKPGRKSKNNQSLEG